MKPQLKKLSDQVVVLTGASSGIGLVTARLAAKRGASLVLVSRNEDALRQLAVEINSAGGQAIYCAADVAVEEQLRQVAHEARQRFGRIDTWINNAGVSIYGKLEEVRMDDHRRLFETNFWGVVNGSRVAVEHLRQQGGALINLGSILSDRAVPLQGMYSASKHAVKGFTDALRMELEEQGLAISVTLIKPSAIDTPYTEHAKNYMEVEPKNPPPVYAPNVVAETILYAAEHPVRDLYVGGGGRAIVSFGNNAPRTADKVMERVMFRQQRSERPAGEGRPDALHGPSSALQERGGYRGMVRERSYYTAAAMHPLTAAAVAVGAGLAVAALLAMPKPPGRRGLQAAAWAKPLRGAAALGR